MNVAKALGTAIRESGSTQLRVAKSIGYKGQSSVGSRIRGNITVKNLLAIADAIGYEVVLQKKKPGRRPEGQYVLDINSGKEDAKK